MNVDEVPVRSDTDPHPLADSRSLLCTFPGHGNVLVRSFALLVANDLALVPIDLDIPIRLRVFHLNNVAFLAVLRHQTIHSRLAEIDRIEYCTAAINASIYSAACR